MEELLAGVLDELKTLKEQVKAVSEAQQVAVPAGGAPVNIAQVPGNNQQGGACVVAEPQELPPTPLQVPVIVPSTSYTYDQVSMATPVPSSSLPIVDLVPENIRKDIIRGKDINLAQLLLPTRERGVFSGTRDIKIGDETLTLKPLKDKRLTRSLTIQEFVKAFNIFKNILCQAFPQRRVEMDRYMSHIIDMATKFPGLAFYEYHLEFSARAAYYREHHQCLIDWGSLDDRLLTQVVAGRKANTCSLCSAFDHEANFCHLAAESDAQPNASSQSQPSTLKTCWHYNSERGCNKKNCLFRHACNVCQNTGHPEVKCLKKKDNKSHKIN